MSNPPEILQITTEYTNNSVATTPSVCQCDSCQAAIQVGDPRFYVSEHGHPERPGRYICGPCMQHYMNKPVTTARIQWQPIGTVQASSAITRVQNFMAQQAPASKSVDLSIIKTMINQSQCQGAHTPQGRVTAISTIPPLQPPALLRSIRPTVSSPSFFQQYFSASASQSSTTTSPSQPTSGYSDAHRKYDKVRQQWASKAYNTPQPQRPKPGQVPMQAQTRVEIRVLFHATYQDDLQGKVVKTAIREGKAVDYAIYPQELFECAKTTLLAPLTKWAKAFPWDFSEVVLRETLAWQDVLKTDPSIPYFNNRFLKKKPGSKIDGSVICVPPKNPIEFSLLFDQEQWLQAEQFIAGSVRDLHSDYERPVTPDTVLKRKIPPSPEKLCSPVKSSLPKHQNISNSEASSAVLLSKLAVGAPEKSMQVKFKGLNIDQVKKGIAFSGQDAIMDQRKEFNMKISDTVSCFLVNPIPFVELCGEADESTGKIVDHMQQYLVFITYNKNDYHLGKGTFKTVTLASLTWISSPLAKGFAERVSSVTYMALKRPYDNLHGSARVMRYDFTDESRRVLTEGTLLGWADSLLRFAYEFIDDFMGRQAPSKDPFPVKIPHLQFVKATVAYSVLESLDLTNKRPKKASSVPQSRRTYLLEQLIPADLPFIKYIHNAEAAPLQNPEEEGYEMAVFLCFIQHLQYQLTHGQAFISDFQGAGDFLMDPQVMTHPSLANSEHRAGTLFGEGNVRDAFDAFPTQHMCNKYCEWFHLEQLSIREDVSHAEDHK